MTPSSSATPTSTTSRSGPTTSAGSPICTSSSRTASSSSTAKGRRSGGTRSSTATTSSRSRSWSGSRRSRSWCRCAHRATSIRSGAGGSSTSSSIQREASSGTQVGTRSRVFKVLKTPVPLDEQPEPLRSLLGYEFYEESPTDHRIREYLLNPAAGRALEVLRQGRRSRTGHRTTLEELGDDGSTRTHSGESRPHDLPGRDDVGRGTAPGQPEARARAARPSVLPRQALPLAVEDLTAAVSDDLSARRPLDPPPGEPLRRPARERGPLDPPPPARPRRRRRRPEAGSSS